jgi:hypothetical protein
MEYRRWKNLFITTEVCFEHQLLQFSNRCVCVRERCEWSAWNLTTHRGERKHIFTTVYERSTRITYRIVTNWLNAYNATFSTTSILQHPADLFRSGFWYIFHQAEPPSQKNSCPPKIGENRARAWLQSASLQNNPQHQQLPYKDYRAKPICTPEDNQLGRNVWYIYIYEYITNSMVWVRERTKPTEQPPLVGEEIANFCG